MLRVYNEAEILQELKKLEDGELMDKVYEAVRQGAELLRDEAKNRAPVRTGALRDSIKARVTRPRTGKSGVSGKVFCDYPKTGRVRKSSTKKQRAGAREYYAFAVEYGTRTLPERPFLKPAAEDKAGEIAALIAGAMQEAIKE